MDSLCRRGFHRYGHTLYCGVVMAGRRGKISRMVHPLGTMALYFKFPFCFMVSLAQRLGVSLSHV